MTQPDHSPAAERNKQPILDVLKTLLPAQGDALEIASGTGQHVTWFAQHLPQWNWQPTEVHPGALYNIEVRVAEAGLENVHEALQLDVRNEPWFADAPAPTAAKTPATSPGLGQSGGNSQHRESNHSRADDRFGLILCINMIHIAPWESCLALMRGAARYLTDDGVLVTYGPYFEQGVAPTQSNIEFDQSLRAHDASWGIRQLEDVEQAAALAGLRLGARHQTPANNLLLVWRRGG
jgi:hypothetical protein